MLKATELKWLKATVYFRQESVKCEYFKDGDKHYTRPLKGRATYYDSVVSGEGNTKVEKNYLEPKEDVK